MAENIAGRSEVFLNLYRIMEELLLKKYYDGETPKGSVVVRFMNESEGKRFRDKLDLCREIRNLLSHHADDENGDSVVEPSQAMVDFLQTVVDYLKSPPMALELATRSENIVKAGLNQKALTVMQRMEKRGFSHVPVFDGDVMVGVFSISTVFSYIVKNRGSVMDSNTEIVDFYEMLPTERHKNEQFVFMSAEATVSDVRAAFEAKRERSRRLAVVFITEHGQRDERLLGMLTPWDVL